MIFHKLFKVKMVFKLLVTIQVQITNWEIQIILKAKEAGDPDPILQDI
jgi:hypothetical protein